jgi:hypothetical protein
MAFKFTPAAFELPPAGIHPAHATKVVDLGTQETAFGDRRRIMLGFELAIEERMEDGRPYQVSRTFTLSWHEKSSLRQFIEDWRGKKLTRSDINEFELTNLLGTKCILTIQHAVSEDREFANVTAVAPAASMKGAAFQPRVADLECLILEPGEFSEAAFERLSDKLKEKIEKSPEYLECRSSSRKPQRTKPQGKPDSDDDLSDAIPF